VCKRGAALNEANLLLNEWAIRRSSICWGVAGVCWACHSMGLAARCCKGLTQPISWRGAGGECDPWATKGVANRSPF